jgi:hypothetical protein
MAEFILLDKGRSPKISADTYARCMEISGRWPSCHRVAVWGCEDFGALPFSLCNGRIYLVR